MTFENDFANTFCETISRCAHPFFLIRRACVGRRDTIGAVPSPGGLYLWFWPGVKAVQNDICTRTGGVSSTPLRCVWAQAPWYRHQKPLRALCDDWGLEYQNVYRRSFRWPRCKMASIRRREETALSDLISEHNRISYLNSDCPRLKP